MATDKVMLKASDGDIFEVDEHVANESETVKNLILDIGKENVIFLPNVSSKVLIKVIEYWKYHVDTLKQDEDKPATPEEEIKVLDAEFMKVEQTMLLDLVLASNYLDAKNLLDFTCQAVADMLKAKEEFRKIFNIENGFTPEEEEEIRRENQWAFD